MIQKAKPLTSLAQQHLQALHIGSEVTRWFRKEREPHVIHVTPENVVAALHKAGINPVLMGVHGINVYRDQPRATQDVDVLVTKKDSRKTIRVLEEAFPYLEIMDGAAAARFLDPISQKMLIDVMKPSSVAMQVVFRNSIAIGDTHRIPDLEMALVSKFVAMMAPTRRADKKLLDAGDFTNLVQHNRAALDLKKLQRLGNRVQPQGGKKILALIGEIDAGVTIRPEGGAVP